MSAQATGEHREHRDVGLLNRWLVNRWLSTRWLLRETMCPG